MITHTGMTAGSQKTVLRELFPWWALGLLVILILGLFIPLQGDEITWDISDHRAIADKLEVITLLPQCQEAKDFAKPLPLIWYPYAAVTHLLFMQMDGILWIRIIGITCFLLFLAAAWYIIKALAPVIFTSPVHLFVLFSCALCLDVLPFVMQINRPEQTLLLGAAIFMALALHASSLAYSPLSRYSAAGLFILTALLVFPSHPRSASLLPIALICGYELFHKITRNKAWTLLVLMLVAGIGLHASFFWLKRYGCPLPIGEPVRSIISNHSLPFWITSDPAAFVSAFLQAFVLGVTNDFFLYHFLPALGWIPITLTPLPKGFEIAHYILNLAGSLFRLSVFIFCLKSMAKMVVGWMRGSFIQSFRESTSSFLTLLGCAVTITLIGFMGASGTDRMIYHPGFEVPLTCLCALVWLCAIRKNAISSKYWLCCDMLIKIAAACNIMLLIYCYFPFITQPETREYRYMFTPWDYEAQKKAVMEAYYACGFPPLTEAKHLVIDNYSSPVLKHSYEPFDFDFATNLTLYTYGGDINVNDLFSLMKRYQSDGILLNCRHVTTNLAPFIEKHGDYCCVPPATIWKYHPLQSGNKGTLP